MAALPKEIQYNKPMASLPSDTRMSQTIVRPSNGATFTQDGNIIQFDLPAHSFLVPNSLCLNLNIKVGVANNDNVIKIRGCPAASWISRVETIVGGSLLESVSDYGRLYNMISQAKLSFDEKAMLYTEFGYGGGGVGGVAEDNPTFHDLNGRDGPTSTGTDGVDGTFPVSLPLGCLLASCTELIPLGHMGGVRMQITTAQLSEYLTVTGTGTPTMTFSDLELTFDLVDFGAGMDSVVRSMAIDGDLVLKSQGWNVTNVNFPDLAAATDATYIYNVRLSSIKSLVLQLTGEAGNKSINAGYDAVKAGGKTGSVQMFLANRPFPPTPLRETNTAAIKSALRQAFGDAHDIYSSRNAITQKQWGSHAELLAADANASTVQQPAAHFYGINTEKLSSNAVMMSGESSQLTPINVRVNTSSATEAAATLTLYACYDALIALNVNTRQVSVRV